MKRAICVLVLIVICFSFASCGDGSNVEIPDGMKLASGKDDSFYLFVPTSWTCGTISDLPYAFYSATDTSAVTVMYYLPGEAKAEATTTATGTAETNAREPYINDFWYEYEVDMRSTYGTSYTLVEEKEAVLDTYFAKQYTITWNESGGDSFKQMSVVTYYSELMFCITYTATAENYDKHIEEVNTIIAEFKFGK